MRTNDGTIADTLTRSGPEGAFEAETTVWEVNTPQTRWRLSSVQPLEA